jgi:antitoxin component YwqK of YwqJK toxin-antitoxin module
MKTKQTKYHKDGSLWAEGYLTDGKLDGYWKWYRTDGSKMRTGYFENGKQVGEWMTYDKNGKLVKKTSF